MRRYDFLNKSGVFSALNKLRAAFLAAKDGGEVEEIINGVLTYDERMRIGRRIEVAEMISAGFTYEEIKDDLKVGPTTIRLVSRKLLSNPKSFDLINKRVEKVEKEYKRRSYTTRGGSKLVYKKREYTGFKRKGVKR